VLTYRWGYLQQEFMQAKLIFVGLLYVYHGYSQVIFTQLQKGISRWTSTQLRLWNEVSTLLLFAIVFLIVLKNTLSMLWGMLGLIGLFVVLLLAIKLYKKYRTR
jgi:putative membrane protein